MFDQQPIGNGSKIPVDQYPADFNPADIDTKKQPVPLGKRLSSKVLKIKKQALQQLLKVIQSQNHLQFIQHQIMIIKYLADSIMQCQLLSLKILFTFLTKQNSYQGDCKVVIKNVVQKIMVLDKEEMQSNGMDVLFWMFDHGSAEILLTELNQYVLNKNPKVVAAALNVIRIFVHNYGPKKLTNLQVFTKHFKILAENVRPVAKVPSAELFKQIFKWIGQSCFTQFNMHPQVKDDVLKWSKTYQMQSMQIKRGLKKGEEGKKINPLEEDEDNSVPVDILPHYDPRWVDMVIALQKWKQKKQHLQEFIKKTRVANIVPRQTSHYITLLKRLLVDNNINLLQCAFKIISNLCKGLKKHFSLCCKSFLSHIYLKLKDSKVMIVQETLQTLKVMTLSISLEDMSQEIKCGLKDKSPQMRGNTLKLLKEFCKKKDNKTIKILKSLVESLVQLTNDGISDVRDVSLAILCTLKQYNGILFFEDKLKGLPDKKLNQIRSTQVINQSQFEKQNNSNKMQIEQQPHTNSFSVQSNKQSNGLVRAPIVNKNIVKVNQKRSNSVIPSIPSNQYAQSFNTFVGQKPSKNTSKIVTKQQQKSFKNPHKQQIKNITYQNPLNKVNKVNKGNEEVSVAMEAQDQQWPSNPQPHHVHRLITLFTHLGQPFKTLATPFRLKKQHFNLIQNFSSTFMIQNADILLKWALWRILIEDKDTADRVVSIVLHMIYILKNDMNDSQMFLIMSIISNSLQHDCTSIHILVCINTSILEISQLRRDKMFNFWISTLNQSTSNHTFSTKILELLNITFKTFNFTTNQLIAMARVQAIAKNTDFINFIIKKGDATRNSLKVYGFNFQDYNQGDQLRPSSGSQSFLLKCGGAQFCTNASVQQKHIFLQIFKKNSNETQLQINQLRQKYTPSKVMQFHIKVLDTILVPYLSYSLQSINIYKYFKNLTNQITSFFQQGLADYITPYLRNIIRLLMFFLVDLSQSKMDNKDQLMKFVNKIILLILQNTQAQHLIEVQAMILKYAVKNNLDKKLTQLLMKCINKTVKSSSFRVKSQKNVRFLVNFFVALIDDHKIENDQSIFKSIKSLFIDLTTIYKQNSMEVALEKINQKERIQNEEIYILFRNFVGFISNRRQENRQENTNPNTQYYDNSKKCIQNQKSTVTITYRNPQTGLSTYSVFPQNQMPIIPSPDTNKMQIQVVEKIAIRETTNLPQMQRQSLVGNENSKVISSGQRRRLQNMQSLSQSLQDLYKFKQETSGHIHGNEQLK